MPLTSQDACNQDGCHWNLPVAVSPSTAVNTCTHTAVDSQNTAKITLCMPLTSPVACIQDGCQWNKPLALFTVEGCRPPVTADLKL